MSNHTRIRSVLLLLLAGPAVRAGEPYLKPHLTVEVTDAATGRPLGGVVCCLVRPGHDTAYARFEGRDYVGATVPRAGDQLHVYRRGYELHTTTTDAKSERVRVALRACALACSVQLEGPGAEAAALVLEVLVRAPGGVRDKYTIRARGPRCRVFVARDLVTRALVTAGPGLAWPATVALEPGKECRLRYEAPRLLPIRRAASLRLRVAHIEVMPDRLWVPDALPTRIDAWRWRLNTSGWLRAPLVAGARTLPVTPDIPFHVFASVGGRGIYRHVARSTDALDLMHPFVSRRLSVRPVVDGTPVPTGTWIAPGRLDLHAMASLAELAASLDGCVHQCGPPDEAWAPITLPAAPWLTVWRSDRGLAHLRWVDGSPVSGRRYRGRVVLEVPRGHAGSGHVSLFPVWKGTGAIRAVPPDRLLRRRLQDQRAISFGGLPPGRYGIDVQITWTRNRLDSTWRVDRTLEVNVPGNGLPVRLFFPVR